jgi:hypothetical protein
MKSNFNTRVKVLLRDEGYQPLQDGDGWRLVQRGIAGYSDRVLPGWYKSLLSAAEHLIPIIGPEFGDRYRKIYNEAAAQ